jgi:O-antigen ligase
VTDFALPAPPSWSVRVALRVVQFGALAVVVAASDLRAFDLDRFFVPKEMVLHLIAVMAALLTLRAFGRAAADLVDVLLVSYLALGVVSAILATNHWLALRALAITASSLLLFWIARVLRANGMERAMIHGLALAVVLAAVTALAQTYGAEMILFSENRAPGGTLGNRNFVAHIAAFGSPLLIFAVFRARSLFGSALPAIGFAVTTACLVLTRSRAAWLAFAVAMVIVVLAALSFSQLRTPSIWSRLSLTVLITGAAVAAALAVPNTLQWRGDDPYLDSVRRIADFEGGSGRGRLIQYRQSLLMAVRHPLLGVGPGNWSVEYPEHAARRDPSMNPSEPGATFNPWPSSDWMAWISERGFPAAALLLVAFAIIGWKGLAQTAAAIDPESAISGVILCAILAAAMVAGTFDAVLLLAPPSLLVWAALGALFQPVSPRQSSRMVFAVALLFAIIGAARSTAQLTAMQIYATVSDRASLTRAARIDPGNDRLRLRLARMGGKGKCEHARAALELRPHAEAAQAAARECE